MHRVTYFHDVTVEDVPDGQTLLDVSIRQRIPHLHQCGARGRCTTCRVQILDGIAHVSARSPIEQKVASQRGWDEFTRLACQTKVHGAVVIRRLLDNPQDIIVLDLDELHGVAAGEGKELELAVLFSDIRNFATHSEKNLPYDVVHILNRYFTQVLSTRPDLLPAEYIEELAMLQDHVAPMTYEKTILSDLQGAWACLRETVVEYAGFEGWERLLFHIDEAMSWETVRHLERMEPLVVLIRNLVVQGKAPDKVIEDLAEVTEILKEVYQALKHGEPL